MADILIRGMVEMPPNCSDCPIRGDAYCRLTREKVKYHHEYRHDRCPLHELPEHGDLIDLDERLTGIIYDEHNNDTDMVTMTAREWLGSVDDIPTVIVPSNKEDAE